jgi:calcineurin-like phosphoesterase family protein
LWLAAEWQFNAAQSKIESADIRIGLMHHPVDWLNPAERDVATRRISGHFHFWLHGHEHTAWVVPTQGHVTIAAGAVGAETRMNSASIWSASIWMDQKASPISTLTRRGIMAGP